MRPGNPAINEITLLTQPTYLNLDNVVDFMSANKNEAGKLTDFDHNDWDLFPKLVLPWPRVEARMRHWHVKAASYELDSPHPADLKWVTTVWCGPSPPGLHMVYPVAENGGISANWSAWLNLWRTIDPRRVKILEEGRARTNDTNCHPVLAFDDDVIEPLQVFYAWMSLRCFLFGINLAHCKNVALVNKPENRAERRRKQRTGIPLIIWKVLQIEPITRQTRAPAEAGGLSKMRQALHIARGHFKTFDERPLFGKLRGTFWWNQQWRGSFDSGLVVKDYSIGAPDTAKSGSGLV